MLLAVRLEIGLVATINCGRRACVGVRGRVRTLTCRETRAAERSARGDSKQN